MSSLQLLNANIAGMANSGTSRQRPNPKLRTSMSCTAAVTGQQVAMAAPTKKTNFYQVLSLGSGKVGLEEIKKAYRSMALRYHPDVCLDPSAKEESTRRFVELQKAYQTLSDPISRKLHDYDLGIRMSKFPKHVWEAQLSGLREKSRLRMDRKRTK